MSATLGGLIKDLRLQKNISQLEIAFALGWKEPSRLSRIEQGKVGRPPRELIDKIMDAMKLSVEERNSLLLVGNYLPTKDEVEIVRSKIKPLIDNWLFPSTSLDFSWRIIYSNKQRYKMSNIKPEKQREMENDLPNAIEVIFDPSYNLSKSLLSEEAKEKKEYLNRMLLLFRHDQKDRVREKWYQDLVRKMMQNKLFKELWLELQSQKSKDDVSDYSSQSFVVEEKGNTRKLNFYFFRMHVLGDPRFVITYYVPADVQTFQYFHKK